MELLMKAVAEYVYSEHVWNSVSFNVKDNNIFPCLNSIRLSYNI